MRTNIGNSNIRGKKIIKKISKPKLRKGGANGEGDRIETTEQGTTVPGTTVPGTTEQGSRLKPLPLTDIQKGKIRELIKIIEVHRKEIEYARDYINMQDNSYDIKDKLYTETRYYYHFLIELINILDNALKNNGKIIFANENEYYNFQKTIFNNYSEEIMSIYRYKRDKEDDMPLGGKIVARAEIYYKKINSDVKSFFDDNQDKKYDYIKSFLVNNNYNNDERLDIFIAIINKIIEYLHKEVMYHKNIIVNRQTSHDGGASKVVVKKALNPYNKYVAKQFPSMKKKFPNEKASEIMKKIAIEWNKTKAKPKDKKR